MNKKKAAFTLLEMIITMAITITVLSIAGSMFTTGNKVFSDSDVKSTLQIEGQAIQEKISDIGMQGITIISTNDNSLIIQSYVKDDDTPRYFKIQQDGNKLIINKDKDDSSCANVNNNMIISEDLESLKMTPSNGNKSMDFDIKLTKKKGFSNVSQEITFTINFRNKIN